MEKEDEFTYLHGKPLYSGGPRNIPPTDEDQAEDKDEGEDEGEGEDEDEDKEEEEEEEESSSSSSSEEDEDDGPNVNSPPSPHAPSAGSASRTEPINSPRDTQTTPPPTIQVKPATPGYPRPPPPSFGELNQPDSDQERDEEESSSPLSGPEEDNEEQPGMSITSNLLSTF